MTPTKRTDKQIAAFMKLARLDAGYTQVKWAKKLKIDQAAVSRLESGHQSPTVRQLMLAGKLAEYDFYDPLHFALKDAPRELREWEK